MQFQFISTQALICRITSVLSRNAVRFAWFARVQVLHFEVMSMNSYKSRKPYTAMPWLLYPPFRCAHTSLWPLRCGTRRKLRAIHTCTSEENTHLFLYFPRHWYTQLKYFRCTYKHSSIDFYQVFFDPFHCYFTILRMLHAITADSLSNESHFEWKTFITFEHENGISKKRRKHENFAGSLCSLENRLVAMMMTVVQRVIDIGERLCRCPGDGHVSSFNFFLYFKAYQNQRVQIAKCCYWFWKHRTRHRRITQHERVRCAKCAGDVSCR